MSQTGQVREILKAGHPNLLKVAEVIDPTSTEAATIRADIQATVDDFGPVGGLAATQIDHHKQIFLFQVAEHRVIFEGDELITPTFVANPEITYYSDEMKLDWEGCLSAPDLFIEIPRPRYIRYKYQDESGKWIERKAQNYHAKAIQHELDHLNGKIHLNRITPTTRIAHTEEFFKYYDNK